MSAARHNPLSLSRERRGRSPQAMGGEGLLLKAFALRKKKTLTQPSPVKTGEGLEARPL
ncbi:hypothetical protein FHS31_000699 [Sphingomonas vulcanisoli]|uniref:Uncharacterized protein n=1 Tax=Sphingomonas vulcanisoli TaxID=1658060 RepID=A0ABX0TNL9_9SPHN|nr:hypothetical protein [Sphingomonas vulcanisoli]